MKLLIFLVITSSLVYCEDQPAMFDNSPVPGAVAAGVDKLSDIQKTVFKNIGYFAVSWIGLPCVDNSVVDEFKLKSVFIKSDELTTTKEILFDDIRPFVFVSIPVDNERCIFGPIIYDKNGIILTDLQRSKLLPYVIRKNESRPKDNFAPFKDLFPNK